MQNLIKYQVIRDFPGGPGVKTPCFHCRGCRFDSWSREVLHAVRCSQKKEKRKKKIKSNQILRMGDSG